MLKKVEKYIQDHGLLNSSNRVIVGVSGGADSIALLHILHSLGYQCLVAHCNFKLRMADSDSDEDFVRSLALSMNLPFFNISFDTNKYANTQKISIEMAARELRYNWFEKLLNQNNAQAIAVAHHLDDSIETLLMNLVRGTGLKGMTGISAINGNVIRPLLCINRTDVENYLMKYNLEYRTDLTNFTLDYTRNKIRNQILPLLKEINPSIQQTLYATTVRFEEINSIYNIAINKIRDEIVKKTDTGIIIDIDLLKKQHNISTILFEILYSYGFHPDTIQKISTILDGETGKTFYSEKFKLIKNRNQFIVNEIVASENCQFEIYKTSKFIHFPFEIKINTFEKMLDFVVSKEKNIIHIDADKISFPLILRKWEIGDSFFPFGMRNRKKISDFFIDQKLSLFEKENIWLLLSDNQIVWIVGYRTDNRFRITEDTKQILELSV